MNEPLREFVDSRGVSLRVDRQSGVIRGVKILGLQSRNGRSYLPEALARAAALYEGAKVNVNHPKGRAGGPRDYQDRIGLIRGVALRPGEGLFADFHFNPKHALAEQLLWDAEHAPENVGFSHNVEARVARRGEQTVVEAITRVESVDLVADPATTRGLFEAAGAATATADDAREAELASLRAEAARLGEEAAALRRRETARRLLREHRLPDLDADDPAARSIVGPAFVDMLLAAESEEAMRAMVAERAGLVRALGGLPAARGEARPVARDQRAVDDLMPIDAKAFARAIT
jgi:hypothetical protein